MACGVLSRELNLRNIYMLVYYIMSMTVSVSVCVGGGVLVVGQEQDARGGQFSSSESYVGHVHGINLWDYALSHSQIQLLAASCGYLGNVMAWPDLLAGINGHIQQINTSFCAGSFFSL